MFVFVFVFIDLDLDVLTVYLNSSAGIIDLDKLRIMSRILIGRLEDRVDWSNYDYSKLKKKEGKENYSTRYSGSLYIARALAQEAGAGGWDHVAYDE